MNDQDQVPSVDKLEANRKRSESCKRAWAEGKGKLKGKKQDRKPCKCGCGNPARLGRLYAKGCYDPGAAHRGRKHGEKWKKKQAEGVKAAWADGKYEGKTRPNYEAIAAKNRGKKRSQEAIEATRKAVKEAWSRGAYAKPETVEKRKRHLTKLHAQSTGAPREHLDRIRAQRDLDKLRPVWRDNMKANVEKWRKDGTMQKNCDANRKRLYGGHGQGKNKRGSLEHSNAKTWRIRSPLGEVFEFVNCREWVRQNIHRFQDYRPESRMPFTLRVSHGLKNIRKPKHANAPTHYQGWMTLAAWERSDLLGRDESEII